MTEGWKYDIEDISATKSIGPGRFNIFSESKPGWMLGSTLAISDPDVPYRIRYDEALYDFTANDLLVLGLTEPNPSGFWLSRYDVGPPAIYAMVYAPDGALSFKAKVEVYLEPVKEVSLYLYAHLIAYVDDLPKFQESLRRLNISEAVEKALLQKVSVS